MGRNDIIKIAFLAISCKELSMDLPLPIRSHLPALRPSFPMQFEIPHCLHLPSCCQTKVHAFAFSSSPSPP